MLFSERLRLRSAGGLAAKHTQHYSHDAQVTIGGHTSVAKCLLLRLLLLLLILQGVTQPPSPADDCVLPDDYPIELAPSSSLRDALEQAAARRETFLLSDDDDD